MRERSNNLYGILPYYISKILGEIPLFIVSNNLFCVLVYFSCELNDTFSYQYWSFVVLCLYATVGGAAYAFFLGSLSSSPETLININIVFNVPLFLLSGFFADAAKFAPFMIPIEYLSVYKYFFQSLVEIEFGDAQPLNCLNYDPSSCTPLANRFIFKEPFYVSLIGIGCIIVLFKTVSFIVVYFTAKIKV